MSSAPRSPPLLLAVDANVLVSLSLRRDSATRIGDIRLRLLIAEYTFAEFRRHIPRRVQEMAWANNMSAEHTLSLHTSAVRTANIYTRRLPLSDYQRHEAEARIRIPADPDDWHTAALALAYGAAIWTEDRHFWGCGIAVWTTQRLLAHLTMQ